MPRSAVLERLAASIASTRTPHPTRVGIDGLGAAGKTTLAEELVPLIQRHGRPCLRASIDDFHRPGHKHRSASGAFTPESYYDEAFDYDAFRRLLLEPLGPDGDRRCRLAIFDSFNDRPFPELWREVDPDAVVVVDARFLFRPDLISHWDYTIWLEIDFDTSLERARQRDVAWVESEEKVVGRYLNRNFPAHRRYLADTSAPELADTVIDNRDPEAPTILRLRAEPQR